MKRRDFIKIAGVATCPIPLSLTAYDNRQIIKRKIPSSGELLPIVGVGTWQTFDVGSSQAEREPLKQVLQIMRDSGGSVVDSSPMYGRSEKVVGELSSELGISDQLFAATKVWTSGKESGINLMERSMDLMKKRPMDLMQIHNLQDWQTHIKTLMDWKKKGIIRYIGITHYVESAYSRMEQIMKNYPIDFIQLNYSITSRSAENSILPLARDKGISVLVNRPYEGGSLFRRTKGKELPPWATDLGIKSWGQYFLKFILSNPSVTCVIPGTDKPHHMTDNMGAGFNPMPDIRQRQKMVDYFLS